MAKYEYNAEYEIKASPKLIYPYLSTAQGLSEWFAEKVIAKSSKIFDIHWDEESHLAEIVGQRINVMVRYQFFPINDADKNDNNRLELRLSYNEFTESTFLSVTDYSEMNDDELLKDLWDGLVEKLQDLIGG